MRERRRAQNRMRRDPYSEFLRIEYRRAKAKARRTVREAQVTSWRELISMFNHRTPMKKLWETLRKFNYKGRISRQYPVLIENDATIDDPLEVANTFGRFFAGLRGRVMYPEAFLQRERTLIDTMPDFESDNTEDYNKEFSFCELTKAISRSGSTSVGPDKKHYDFFQTHGRRAIARTVGAVQLLVVKPYFPTNMETFVHCPYIEAR